MTVAPPRHYDDFDAFYRDCFPEVVAYVFGYTADLAAAQDIAQETFCRAWVRWDSLVGYDNPLFWARRVAFHLAHSRWRRLTVAAKHLFRQRLEDIPELSADRVAVITALRRLPKRQQEAIVLHYVVDMPVDEVAKQLGAPEGTVKSWLHRGRAALAAQLREDERTAIIPASSAEVVRRAKRRQRARLAKTIAVLVLLVLGITVGVRLLDLPAEQQPVQPPPLPSPSVFVDPSDPILNIDWPNATIAFEAEPAGCPLGTVAFTARDDSTVQGPLDSWPRAYFSPAGVTIAEIAAAPGAEALIKMDCYGSDNVSSLVQGWLLVRRFVDGTLHGVGWLPGHRLSTWVANRVVFRGAEGGLGATSAYQWNGVTFAEVEASGGYPEISALNIGPVAVQLRCGSLPPALSPIIYLDALLESEAEGRRWEVQTGIDRRSVYFELGRTGQPYLVLNLTCQPIDPADPERATSVVVFDRTAQGWTAVAAIVAPVDAVIGFSASDVHGRRINTYFIYKAGPLVLAPYEWDGKRFVAYP